VTHGPPPPTRPAQFVVKLADRSDYLLASRVLACGVEFGVLAQSFSAALSNVFLTALAVWVPLAPLIFLMRRMMEDRTGSRCGRSWGD